MHNAENLALVIIAFLIATSFGIGYVLGFAKGKK